MVKKIYTDSENELQTYINDDNKCFIEITQLGEEMYGTGFIVLDSTDLEELIKDLVKIKNEINENTARN